VAISLCPTIIYISFSEFSFYVGWICGPTSLLQTSGSYQIRRNQQTSNQHFKMLNFFILIHSKFCRIRLDCK
jgi:hypothetical protein